MLVEDAQREVRSVYIGGFIGQLVSAAVWLVSAIATTWLSFRAGVLSLVIGGMFIFPLTQLVLRIMRRPAALTPANPLRELALEIAFIVPLLLPLAGGAALYKTEWFYPACMMIVGAHYLPFAFLYGMRHFLALGSIMLGAGLLTGMYTPELGLHAAYLNVALLIGFGFLGRRLLPAPPPAVYAGTL